MHYITESIDKAVLVLFRQAIATQDLLPACKKARHLVEENNEEIVKMAGSFGLLSDLQAAITKAEEG